MREIFKSRVITSESHLFSEEREGHKSESKTSQSVEEREITQLGLGFFFYFYFLIILENKIKNLPLKR